MSDAKSQSREADPAADKKASTPDQAGRDDHARDSAAQNMAAGPRAPATKTRPRWLMPATRILFWVAGLSALGAAGLAAFAANAAGWQGFILLSGVAFVAFLFLYALAAGESAARVLSDTAPQPGSNSLASQAFDALADPVVITGTNGRAVWANRAYRQLSEQAAGLGSRLGVPAPDRVWAGAAGGAIYRLTRAAQAGEAARARQSIEALRARLALARPLTDALPEIEDDDRALPQPVFILGPPRSGTSLAEVSLYKASAGSAALGEHGAALRPALDLLATRLENRG